LGKGLATFVCHVDMEKSEPGFTRASPDVQRSKLQAKLDAAGAVLILWDHNYARAAWCAWELAVAAGRAGIAVFVKELDPTPIPSALMSRIVVVNNDTEVEIAPARVPRWTALSLERARVVLHPAASLLEARHAPRIGKRTQSLREIASRLGLFAVALVLEYALYKLGTRWFTTPSSEHLWAIVAAVSISTTIVNGFVLSANAAMMAGVCGLVAGMLAMKVLIAWRGTPDAHTIAQMAAGIGTFQVSLLLFARGWLLGYRLGRRRPSVKCLFQNEVYGHGAALLAVVAVAALTLYGLNALDTLTEAKRTGKLDPIELLAVPVTFGLRVGFLVGIALAVAAYRRSLRSHRDTSPWRHPESLLWALVAFTIAAYLGRGTGVWIQENIVQAISKWGGGYAGVQIGVLLSVGLSVPIAAGSGWIGVRQEHAWGLIGGAVVIGIITAKVQSFPFAATRTEVPQEILIGALVGLVPAGIALALSHRGARIMTAAVGIHVLLLIVLSQLVGQTVPDVRARPVTELVISDTPAAPATPQDPAMEAIEALLVPEAPPPPEYLTPALRVPVPPPPVGEPTPTVDPVPPPGAAPIPTVVQAPVVAPIDAPAAESTNGPDAVALPTDPAQERTESDAAGAAEDVGTFDEGKDSGGRTNSGAAVGHDGAADVNIGAVEGAAGAGTAAGGNREARGDGGANGTPVSPVDPVQVQCPGEGAMDAGDEYRCELGSAHTVKTLILSVGCNDGETGDFTLTLTDGAQTTTFSMAGSCNSTLELPPTRASTVVLRMNAGGGGDKHISFLCCGSSGWYLTY
jgi:outer membrane biosynthesis protein TonB